MDLHAVKWLLLIIGSVQCEYEDAELSLAGNIPKPAQLSQSELPYVVTQEIGIKQCLHLEALHIPTNTCHQTGKRGPCNEYERWYAKSEDADEGECYCVQVDSESGEVNHPMARSVDDNHCYPVFSKANCRDPDDWFTMDPNRSGFGRCETNPCLNSTTEGKTEVSGTLMLRILGQCDTDGGDIGDQTLAFEPFWFTHEKKCVRTFVLGTCGPAGGNHTLIFKGTNPNPSCVDAYSPEYKVCQWNGVPYLGTEPSSRTNSCPPGFVKNKNTNMCEVRVKVAFNDYED